MIKACFITKYPPIEGGVSKRGYWTAREMAERGNQIFVVTNASEVEDEYRMLMNDEDGKWYEPQFPESGGFVKVRRTQNLGNAIMHIPQSNPFVTKLSSIATQIVRKHGCEVIYADYLEPYGFAAYLASHWTGVPYMVKHAGSDLGRLMKQRDLVTAYREVFKAADCVWSGMSIEPFLAIGVREENLWTNIEAPLPDIFNPQATPLDLNAFLETLANNETAHIRNIVTNTGRIPTERPTIGIYGKVGEVKGSFDLLAALAILKQRGLDFNFVALTQGRAIDGFKTAIKAHDLEERTWMFPFVPHWRVPGFLRACTAVCFLERDFPIAFHGPQIAKEVFACGTCLVLSGEILDKQPRKRNLSDGANLLIVDDPKDHNELASQLARVIADPARAREIGLEGNRFYVESLARIRRAPKSYVERLEEKLIDVRDKRKARASKPIGNSDDPQDLRVTQLKKRLPGTSALLEGEWDERVREYLDKNSESPDTPFKDAVTFCDFLTGRIAEFTNGHTYLADVLKYERTRNLLLTDLEREPFLKLDGYVEHAGGGRVPGTPRKTFEEIGSIKFVKNRGVRIEPFDYDLGHLMRCLRRGESPQDISKTKTFLLFKKELNFVNLELEVNEATKRLVDLCDGDHTVDSILSKMAEESRDPDPQLDSEKLKCDLLEVIRDLLLKGVILSPVGI